jgi:hypothetical protein
MGDDSRFQLRVAQLIGAYADRAPVDIDPAAMARFIVAEERTRSIRPRFLPSHVGLGFGILVIARIPIASWWGRSSVCRPPAPPQAVLRPASSSLKRVAGARATARSVSSGSIRMAG